jgi:hypothetical protein
MDALDILVDLDERQVMLRVPGQYRLKVISFFICLLYIRVIHKEILLNFSMKCWNSAFNEQGSKVIIVIVQVEAVKIYVSAVEALKKKGKMGWNWVYHQNYWWKN